LETMAIKCYSYHGYCNGNTVNDCRFPQEFCHYRFVWVPGRVFHNTFLPFPHSQGKGGKNIGNQVEEKYLEGKQRHRQIGKGSSRNYNDRGKVTGHKKYHKLPHIFKNIPALFYSQFNRGELVIHKDNICYLLGSFSSPYSHCDLYIGFFKSGSIVYPISLHS